MLINRVINRNNEKEELLKFYEDFLSQVGKYYRKDDWKEKFEKEVKDEFERLEKKEFNMSAYEMRRCCLNYKSRCEIDIINLDDDEYIMIICMLPSDNIENAVMEAVAERIVDNELDEVVSQEYEEEIVEEITEALEEKLDYMLENTEWSIENDNE